MLPDEIKEKEAGDDIPKEIIPANILSTRSLGVRTKQMNVKKWMSLPNLYIVRGQ